MRHIACPVALHPDGAVRRIAACAHPLAGLQLVKGGIGPEERPEAAAARALFEVSGLETRVALLLGKTTDIADGDCWHFCLCRLVPPVRDHWQHLRADGGGPLLRFFWLELDTDPPDGFDPTDTQAHQWIRAAL